MPKLSFILIGALFVCDRAYGLKRAAGAHERLFTVICAIANFLYLCLLLIHSAALAYVLYMGLGTLVSLHSKRSSR